MRLRTAFRFLSFIALALLAATTWAGSAEAQGKAAPNPANPKIRAITAFINLDRAQYQQQVADALKMLKRAQTTFESRGYQVQTIRIATQPFPEYTKGLTNEQAVAFFKQLDALAEQQKFAIALASANVVATAFQDARDLGMARQRLIDSLATVAFDVEHHAGRVDQETGWAYMGIDLSPAPSKEASIGVAIENLTKQPFGMSGTLTAAATITAAIKDVKVKQTGYTGLMLPVLEDTRLAQRWSEGRISLDALLSYSAVCGTGLDTIPLPGDTSAEQLSLIISDMASLAVKWHKPLSARLLPVTGKGWGETTDFDDPFLVNATLQQLDRK